MKPFWSDGWVEIYQGNALLVLKTLSAESVDCVVTSPPYWGLRRYEGEQDLVWDSLIAWCEHQWNERERLSTSGGMNVGEKATVGATKAGVQRFKVEESFCPICNAWQGAFGLEPTPELYLQHSLQFFREMRRVLKKTGVVFWNIGDSYMGGGGNSAKYGRGPASIFPQNTASLFPEGKPVTAQKHPTIKPKDLCLIPQRLAIALQEEGWWVRSIIIWEKGNSMPESVSGWRYEKHRIRVDEQGNRVKKGGKLVECPGCEVCLPNDGYALHKGSWRPTEAHEYILMLAKSLEYYADGEDVREPLSEATFVRNLYPHHGGGPYAISRSREPGEFMNLAGRNLRSVWSFPTEPYPDVHFAVFPERLPELCILSGTSEKCCAKCLMPWARILGNPQKVKHGGFGSKTADHLGLSPTSGIRNKTSTEWQTLGWKPTCKCGTDETVPAVVLDPFAGTGTTGLVAKKLGRKAILIDLSESYCEMARKRVEEVSLPMRL